MNPIITTDEQVRAFTPNVFSTVEGEVSLYDKLQPYLQDTQAWLESILPVLTPIEDVQSILPPEEESPVQQPGAEGAGLDGDEAIEAQAEDEVPAEEVDVEPDARLVLVERILVLEAFRRAIPSLDLVLTPNGFGIVSNDNMAPASTDRVNRLIDQLEVERDLAIENLVNLQLRLDAGAFTRYPQYSHWVKTVFRPFELQRMKGSKRLLATWLQDRYTVQHIESDLADKYISQPVLEMLQLTTTEPLTPFLEHVRSHFIYAISVVMEGKERPVHMLRDLTDEVRKAYPEEWSQSPTYRLYVDNRFENKKTSGGFWL